MRLFCGQQDQRPERLLLRASLLQTLGNLLPELITVSMTVFLVSSKFISFCTLSNHVNASILPKPTQPR
uniref:Uncharacterized protein n=1 Tax=Mesocestoides corti TaxID=53468 RepID=A0A5K3F2D0_MESCO